MATNSQGNNKGKSISFDFPLYQKATKRQRDLQLKTFSQYIQRLVINDLESGGDLVLKETASSANPPAGGTPGQESPLGPKTVAGDVDEFLSNQRLCRQGKLKRATSRSGATRRTKPGQSAGNKPARGSQEGKK